MILKAHWKFEPNQCNNFALKANILILISPQLRIDWFIVLCPSLEKSLTGCSLKCIKSKNGQQFDFKNFLRPSTLLFYEKIICQWKITEKWTLSFFIGDLRHQIFLSSNSNLCAWGKIWWHKSPMKNDKVHFSVFFH